jgi:ankyrin repeat protein
MTAIMPPVGSGPSQYVGSGFSRTIMLALSLLAGASQPFHAAEPAPLAEAVERRNFSQARDLLKQRADVNALQADGTTALHWAAHWDHLETTQLLIKAGANVNAANRYGMKPLSLAASHTSGAVAAALIAAGADPNTASPEGETALMIAARVGSIPTVTALIARGANVNAREAWRGQTALMWAVSENHAPVVKLLLDRGADVHARTNVPTTPFNGGNEGQLPAIYDPGAGGFTPLLFAARSGRLESARVLLAAGANANDALPGGMSAMVLAVMNAHLELASVLLQHGADANAAQQGWSALHQLVWIRNPNRHFNLPPPIPTGSVSSLQLAKTLIERGANVNARMTRQPTDGYRNWMNRVGATPYVMAAKATDVELMRFLVANGADPAIKARDNTTALMAAAGIGWWQGESPGTEAEALAAVKLAIELGDEVNATNENNYTALHGAAVRGANSIVEFLVGKGARLDVVTKREGWTPLKIAEGVFIANTFKMQPATAELLRRLMSDR